ncbi:GNAT family N-acetyltransferase [Limosilactobacillus difficilis]|uniref:GNAT family N-acetyltransferase n=1 Tax=Limosilactobacillus difficilis TaxID=2991838 RepID=UPI0024B9A0B7|nr:GNAT family N-acetyltransferase [Limosilactobacillus difficilis]
MIDLRLCRLGSNGWCLRPLQNSDLSALRNLLADEQLLRQSGLLLPSLANPVAFSWALSRLVQRDDLLGLFTGEHLAGLISLTSGAGTPQRAELGYLLEIPARGRGLMTRAVGHLLRWLARQTDLTVVEAHTMRDNLPSIRVLKRCHFSIMDNDISQEIIWEYNLERIKEEL